MPEFEDGHVSLLSLHHSVDPRLANAVDVEVRRRPVGRADGPPLDHGVRGVPARVG